MYRLKIIIGVQRPCSRSSAATVSGAGASRPERYIIETTAAAAFKHTIARPNARGRVYVCSIFGDNGGYVGCTVLIIIIFYWYAAAATTTTSTALCIATEYAVGNRATTIIRTTAAAAAEPVVVP